MASLCGDPAEPGSPPLVTVVIPTHNRPALLLEALDSVASQTISTWEAVVIDDGSEPAVDAVLLQERYGARLSVLRRDVAHGGPAAKNLGIDAATGPIVAFLDDDDRYSPEYLEKALAVFAVIPDLEVLFMGVGWFGKGEEWGRRTYARAMARTLDMACGIEVQHGLIMFGPQLLRALLTSVPMAFQRPVVRRDAFVKTGFYTEDCLLWDCDWAMRAAVTVSTALLNEPLYLQRLDGQGSSSKNSRELEHIRSGIEIVERLARELSSAHSEPRTEAWLREGAARSWFHLAYFLVHSGEPAEALRAWVQSQRRKLDLRRFRLLARILLVTATAHLGHR